MFFIVAETILLFPGHPNPPPKKKSYNSINYNNVWPMLRSIPN